LELDVEDTAEIGLQFTQGCLGSVHLDYNQRPTMHWLEIVGAQGSLRWDNTYGMVRCYQASIDSWQTFAPPDGFERNTMFLDEMRHFIAVMRGAAQPACSLADGRHALELALSVYESARRGTVISIDKP
jgi:predicted dehydrogenase